MELEVEATKSRSGLHAARGVVVVVGKGSPRIIERPGKPGRGTYSRGIAGSVELDLSPGEYAVWVWLVLNPKGRVSGRVRVYNWEGDLLLEAVIRRRKVRRSKGDASYAWAIEAALASLGLTSYIRRYNWRTGGGQ